MSFHNDTLHPNNLSIILMYRLDRGNQALKDAIETADNIRGIRKTITVENEAIAMTRKFKEGLSHAWSFCM